jgi:hypothetical protein
MIMAQFLIMLEETMEAGEVETAEAGEEETTVAGEVEMAVEMEEETEAVEIVVVEVIDFLCYIK